ncbi:MAG: M56 family metallopeptidase, partial [Bacteroidota bacterium]
MINFLITSSILLFLGWLCYHLWVRKSTNFRQRKLFLYLTVATSLILPWGIIEWGGPILQPNPHTLALSPGKAVPFGELNRYCQCEQPDLSHRISYRANSSVNFMLAHKYQLGLIIGGAMLLTLLVFSLKMAYLFYLIGHSDRQKMRLGKRKFTLLTPERPRGIGAFWLGRPYILWEEPSLALGQDQRQAILEHEWSHLSQGHTVEKIILNLVQCLWFFHPCFYSVKKELDLLGELIADRAASQTMEPKAYARLLLELQSIGNTPSPSSGLTSSLLKRRIEALVAPKSGLTSSTWWLPITLGLQILLAGPVILAVDHSLNQLAFYEEA